MHLPRVSIARMMSAVLFSAFVFAALRAPSPMWAVASFHLAIILLAAAPVIALARKGESRNLWAAFATAGWVRLLFWWLIRGVPDALAIAPWQPFTYQVRLAIPGAAGVVFAGQAHVDFLLTCVYLDATLSGLVAAAVCRFAMRVGHAVDRRPDDAET